MSESLVILCPGQGAQHVGMGKAWAETSKVAADTYAEANDVLGFDLSAVCFDGPEDEVTRTDVAQAAIYVTTVASVRAMQDRGELGDAYAATAGLSLGEYTALHLAGAFGFVDGLRLVRQRGQFMQAAAESAGGSMVAVTGAVTEEAIDRVCDGARGDDVLVPANFNSPMQVVISGSATACERSVALIEAESLKATPLTVAGAFHSPLMQDAADRMAAALDSADWSAPTTTVMSNVTGEPHGGDVETIKGLLVRQITESVRWSQNCQWLSANVAGRYVEPAPGKVLTGLMRRIDKKTRVENHAEPKVSEQA